MIRSRLFLPLCLVLFSSTSAWGHNPCGSILDVEQRFDRTGDHIVDAADWREMDEAQRQAYVRASVLAAGGDPDAPAGEEQTQAQHYRKILEHLYRP